MQKIKKAVILAAGFGTRFLPFTKAVPKEMIPILDKPIIQMAVEEIVEAGINEIIIITYRGKQAIENHFDNHFELETKLEENQKHDFLKKIQETHKDIHFTFVRQNKMQGTADAIYHAKRVVGNEPFAVLFPDDVIFSKKSCMKQMVEVFEKTNSSIIASIEVDEKDIPKYGILEKEDTDSNLFEIYDMVEKPEIKDAPSKNAIIGRYIFTPEIFDKIEKTKPGKGDEIQITDSLSLLIKEQKIYGYIFEGKRFDTGNVLGFLKANTYAALQREDTKKEYLEFLKEII